MVINDREHDELPETKDAQAQADQGSGAITVHNAAPQQIASCGEKRQSVGCTAEAVHECGNGPQDSLALVI